MRLAGAEVGWSPKVGRRGSGERSQPLYQAEGNVVRFLRVISGVSRKDYYPVTEDDRAWAHARYPRRFYNDSKSDAGATSAHPEQWPLVCKRPAGDLRLDIAYIPIQGGFI
jgi:hypothetical protein